MSAAPSPTDTTPGQGITALNDLLRQMAPVLREPRYVFVSVPHDAAPDLSTLGPVAVIREDEGLTLILPAGAARQASLPFHDEYGMISLTVHSALSALGLTAAVSAALADEGISANIVAGYYHDHIFVPADRANDAMQLLQKLSQAAGNSQT